MSGLEQDFAGKVSARNVDATLPENVTQVEALGFKRHGLVVKAAGGEVLFKQADHSVDVEAVKAFLSQTLPPG